MGLPAHRSRPSTVSLSRGMKKLRGVIVALGGFLFLVTLPCLPCMGAEAEGIGPAHPRDPDRRKPEKRPFRCGTVFAVCGTFGKKGFNSEDLYNPSDVGIAGNGDIYVVDTFNHQVKKYRLTLNLEKVIGGHGKGEGRFIKPSSVAEGPAGYIYVADMMNNRVQVFDAQGAFVRAWGVYGRKPGQLANPLALAVDMQGRVYVSDMNNRITIFDSSGKFIRVWAVGLSYASALDYDPESGMLYVADTNNNRILGVKDGTVIQCFRRVKGLGKGLSAPAGVSVCGGMLFVSDSGHDRILVLDKRTGDLVHVFGKKGRDPGEFSRPRGLAVFAPLMAVIADRHNCRVQMICGHPNSKISGDSEEQEK